MSLTEEGMRQRKWGSYEVLGKLLENQEPLLSNRGKMALYQASTYYFNTEYLSDCLDIHLRLRGYADNLMRSESSPPLVDKRLIELLELDLKQLESRISDISLKFAEIGVDIKRFRESILRKIDDRRASK